jgi:hypothetical protein
VQTENNVASVIRNEKFKFDVWLGQSASDLGK